MGILSYILSKIRFSVQPMSKADVAELIDKFLAGDPSLRAWEWDDFISIRNGNPEIEKIRLEVLCIEQKHPGKLGEWCSTEGIIQLQLIANRLRR